MNVLLRVYMCTLCVPGAHDGQEKASDPCRYKLPCGCSESNSCLLKGQQVLLTAEPFKSIFKEKLVVCRVIFHV